MPNIQYRSVTKEVSTTTALWKAVSITSVLCAIPLILLAVIPLILLFSASQNDLSIGFILFMLVPGLAGVAGFTGLVLAVNTPPDANDRKKVRAISVLLSCGFIIEGALLGLAMSKLSWGSVLLFVPMLMALGYVCGDSRESHKRLAEKTAINPQELTGTTETQEPAALGETNVGSKKMKD